MTVTASTSALPFMALSTTEKVLLAQSVCQHGTNDWNSISLLLAPHPLLGAHGPNFTAEFCQAAFSDLVLQEGYDLSQMSAPNARPARKLAQKFYTQRLQELAAALHDRMKEEKTLLTDIEAIYAGKHDEQLLRAVPEAVRLQIVGSDGAGGEEVAPKGRRGKKGSKEVVGMEDVMELDVDEEVRRDQKGKAREVELEPHSKEKLEKASASGGVAQGDAIVPDSEPLQEEKHDVEGVAEDPKERKGKTEGGRKSARGKARAEPEPEEEGDIADDVEKASKGRSGAAGSKDVEVTDEAATTPAEQREQEEEEGPEGEAEEPDEEESAAPVTRKGTKKRAAAPAKNARKSKRKTSEPAEFSPPVPEAKHQKKRQKTDELADEHAVLGKESKVAVARFKKTMSLLIERLLDEPNSHYFKNAVLKSQAPSYNDAVRRPMCIRDVSRRIKEGTLSTSGEVMRDVCLIFANAVQFNGLDADIGEEAKKLWAKFEELMHVHMTTEFGVSSA